MAGRHHDLPPRGTVSEPIAADDGWDVPTVELRLPLVREGTSRRRLASVLERVALLVGVGALAVGAGLAVRAAVEATSSSCAAPADRPEAQLDRC